MEFARVGGEKEWWMDIWLCNEMAEVRRYDVISVFISNVVFSFFEAWSRIIFICSFAVRVWTVSFPFLENGLQLLLCAEQTDSLSTIAHTRFQNPPLTLRRFFTLILLKAGKELPRFDQSIVEKFGVVELEITGRLDVCC